MKYHTILQTIGNTPIVELKRYSYGNTKIFAKLEGVNPGGSIKDRVALYMIKNAIKNKTLSFDKTLIEATSGNTGISLAMISAILGYKFIAVMPESASIERRKIINAYGTKIILTDGKRGTNYAIKVAQELLKKNRNYLMLNQFSNFLNVTAHYETTGLEIIKDVPNITHFVTGMGTGGTLMGVGQRLKELNKNIQIIGVEPKEMSKIQGLRNMKNYKPAIFDENVLDEKLEIKDDDIAFELAKDLFKKEGISAGISSGAALWGTIKVAKKISKGIIVTIFPDRGDKYISNLFL